jgi:Spy/CpxP family protein refolding chaperone
MLACLIWGREEINMKTKQLVGMGALVIMASFLLAIAPVSAQKDSEDYHGRSKWAGQKQEKYNNLISKLGLSEEQAAQLEAHKQAKAESREKQRIALHAQREALKIELEKPVSDPIALKKLADSIKQIQSDMVDARINAILEIKSILTPEQYTAFKEKMGRYREKKMKGDKAGKY